MELFCWRILLLLAAVGQARAGLTAASAGDGSTAITLNGDGVSLKIAVSEEPIAPFGPFRQGLHQKPIGPDERDVKLEVSQLSNDVVEVQVAGEDVGARKKTLFYFPENETFYGVWEYPWNGSITNNGVFYGTQGVFGWVKGINWANARAPFFFTRTGFGVYIDTPILGSFNFSQGGPVEIYFNTTTKPKFQIMFRKDHADLLSVFATLTSAIQMPPDAGYGPTFWSDDFEQDFHGNVTNAEENYYDVVDHLYANRIRATGMIADRPFGTGTNGWGNFDFDPAFYPDPARLMRNLTDWGFHVQAWAANRAYLNTELYNASLANNWFFDGVDPAAFDGPALNLSIPAAYDYFLSRMAYFPELGIRGYKIDRGEEGEMPDAIQNEQMMLFTQLCYDSMNNSWGGAGNSTNFYNFARSAYDRSRAATHVWNGDAYATFEGLRYTVASGIRAGLLGFAQWGSDTGGYLRLRPEEPTEELWARWMHVSAFSPMYEVLVGRGRTPWYAPYTPRLVGVLRDTAALHARLVPYIRSYVYQASLTGVPVIRALFLEYQNDSSVWETADAYAFGAELYVAPVITAGGARTVYLPKGKGSFLDYFGKRTVFAPGSTINITDLPLEDVPVFVQEGAIVPTGDIYQGNAKWIENWTPYLEIEVYPSWNVSNSSFVYYKGNASLTGPAATAVLNVTTNSTERLVSVMATGDFGVDTRVLIYGKNKTHNLTLPEDGDIRFVNVTGFVSLFEASGGTED